MTSGVWRSRQQFWFHSVPSMLGSLAITIIVFAFPDMKNVELVSVCTMIPLLLMAWFVMESPRWLMSKGNTVIAKEIVSKILKINNLPEDNTKNLQKVSKEDKSDSDEKKYTLKDILKYPGMRRNLLCLIITWLANTMGYYGLTFNTPTFEWNVYLVFVLPFLISIPFLIVEPFLDNKYYKL